MSETEMARYLLARGWVQNERGLWRLPLYSGWWPVREAYYTAKRDEDQTDLGASDDRPLGPDHPCYRSN